MKNHISFRNKQGIAKLFSLFVCLVMAMTLIACGNNAESTKSEDQESEAEDFAQEESLDEYGDDEIVDFVKDSPNYKDNLEQDVDGSWVYIVDGQDLHIKTNIWDYITYDKYLDGEVTKTKTGKTFKFDFGELADDLGWSLRVKGLGLESLKYEGVTVLETYGELEGSRNKFGFYPIKRYMAFIDDEDPDKAVFVTTFWGETDLGGAMSYENIIVLSYIMESINDYCSHFGVESFNNSFLSSDDGIGWIYSYVAPQLQMLVNPTKSGAIYLNDGE